jgi:hypothetical protein
MQTLTEKVFQLSPPGGLFDETVIRNLFPDRSEGARKVIVHRAVSKGEIIRLKPGLFLLSEEFRKSQAHPFVIAGMLHSPSHISLESALSFHGFIPEAVFQVSSVTSARSRTYKTPIGFFSYRRVPLYYPKVGVKSEKIDKNSWAFVATPLRAIADLVYIRKEVMWENRGLSFLTESMRIEVEDLRNMSFKGLDKLFDSFRNKRTRDYLRQLFMEMSE